MSNHVGFGCMGQSAVSLCSNANAVFLNYFSVDRVVSVLAVYCSLVGAGRCAG